MNESTGRVFYGIIVFIIPKMRNQPVLPAKCGSLERLANNFSTTARMNTIGRRILLRIQIPIDLRVQNFYLWLMCRNSLENWHFHMVKR